MNTQMRQVFETAGLSYLEEVYAEAKDNLDALNEVELNQFIEEIAFAELIKISFNKVKGLIEKMTLKKRIKMLSELDDRLVFLYQETKGYNDALFGKAKYGPKEFQKIMGKIKHLEIIQTWLYGID